MAVTKTDVVKTQKTVETATLPSDAGRKSTLREYFESIVVTVILALYGTTFAIQAFKIPSSSMEDTLLIGDHLMVDKLAYAPPARWLGPLLPYQQVQRRDIIVFKFPVDPSKHYVKRVVGVPGDRLRIVNQQLYINGHLADEGYKVHKMGDHVHRDSFPGSLPRSVYPDWAEALPWHVESGWLVVPPGHYFAMGDNRDRSEDSRFWGFVPRRNILGKPVLIYWSLKSTSADYREPSLRKRVVGILKTLVLFPFKTRWGRMFLLIRPN